MQLEGPILHHLRIDPPVLLRMMVLHLILAVVLDCAVGELAPEPIGVEVFAQVEEHVHLAGASRDRFVAFGAFAQYSFLRNAKKIGLMRVVGGWEGEN